MLCGEMGMVDQQSQSHFSTLGFIYPNLTNRERDVIPHLASGATAQEIGQHLALSAETVKKHSKKICEKFGGQTLRDVHGKLIDFVSLYIGQPPMFRVCCENMTQHVQVLVKQKKIIITLDHDFRVVSGPVDALKFTTVDGDMPIRSLSIEAGDLVYQQKFLGQDEYVSKLDKPAKTGTTIRRHIEMTRDFDPSIHTPSHYSSWALYPTGQMTFMITHLECDRPPAYQYDVTLDYMEIQDPNLTVEKSDYKFTLRTNRPKLSQVMTISW